MLVVGNGTVSEGSRFSFNGGVFIGLVEVNSGRPGAVICSNCNTLCRFTLTVTEAAGPNAVVTLQNCSVFNAAPLFEFNAVCGVSMLNCIMTLSNDVAGTEAFQGAFAGYVWYTGLGVIKAAESDGSTNLRLLIPDGSVIVNTNLSDIPYTNSAGDGMSPALVAGDVFYDTTSRRVRVFV